MHTPPFNHRQNIAKRGVDLAAWGLQVNKYRDNSEYGSEIRLYWNLELILITWELRELAKELA